MTDLSFDEFVNVHFDFLKYANLDISDHLDILNHYASLSNSVVEMGVRKMVSTYAFIKARPKKLTCIDIVSPVYYLEEYSDFFYITQQICEYLGIDFKFILGNTLEITIEPCDLLFIDTLHEFDQLSKELELHGNKSNQWIIMHDTESARNELIPAIMQFLMNNPWWFIKEIFLNNNGLMVLERNHEIR